MKPHSLACSSPPSVEVWFLIDQEMVLVMTHCAGIVDSCSKPNSGTFCKTNHPASSLFLKKQMALKLEEEQLFSLKGEQPSATYEHILSINDENCFLKIREICTWTGYQVLILLGTNEHFFHILSFYPKYSLCIFCEMFILSLKHFRKNEQGVKERMK